MKALKSIILISSLFLLASCGPRRPSRPNTDETENNEENNGNNGENNNDNSQGEKNIMRLSIN